MPQPIPQETLARGTMLEGRYRIERVIGSGGYASVYKAIDTTYNVERAIKEVTDPDKGVREQFRLEADLLINHGHLNIPRGYNVFEVKKGIYFVMDFVGGKDLEELLNESLTQQRRPLDEARVLRWAIAICDALSTLHHLPRPIIHRDIKPANIKITPDDRPVLIDFGLAKLQQGASATQVAAQGVSPGFAPPEQYMAKGRTDARTDIYGLGATLYACLTGRDPAESPARLLAQTGVTHGSSLEEPRKLNPRISLRTEAVILKSLELSPSKRQQSAAELEKELRDALDALNGASAAGSTMVMPQGVAPTINQQSAKRPVAPAPAGAGSKVATLDSSKQRAVGKRAPAAAAPVAVTPPKVDPRTGKHVAATPAAASVATAGAIVGMGAVARNAAPVVTSTETAQHRTLRDAQPDVMSRASSKHAAAQPSLGPVPTPTAPQPQVAPNPNHRPVLQFKGSSERGMISGGPAVAGVAPAAAATAAVAVAEAERSGKHERGSAKRAAVAPPTSTPAVDSRAWIRLGAIAISGFGKWMLALSAIEALWGVVALSMGIVSIVNHGLPTSLLINLGLGWLVVVAILSLVGGQALNRPIYRRGKLGAVRRGMQGTGLFIFSVVVHLVALWGATIFIASPGNELLAVIAYIIFGLNVLVAGILSVYNILD